MPEDKQVPEETTKTEAPIMAEDKLTEVGQKIAEAHNVLIALSADPSVDEMAAAIGLSLYLDRLGKRATAIYSGNTPNALEFLKPEETFEESVDTLQDFVIALNKEKADHLRYKLDGDFVKIFITPYKTRIDEDDLEFSYGDFNVDLVLALDVANGIDLDAALREHGRIMHDAVIVNITTGNPGKLGEIEWSDKKASSVSEMIADLLYKANSKVQIEKEEATAFLTGIVAATNRFSKANTTPATMKIASKLMESGANQQLISKNITPDVENEIFSMPGFSVEKKADEDASKLDIQHGNEVVPEDNPEEVDAAVTEKESTLLDELKAAEATLASAGAETVPDKANGPVDVNNIDGAINEAEAKPAESASAEPAESTGAGPAESASVAPIGMAGVEAAEPTVPAEGATAAESFLNAKPEKVLQPTGDFASEGFAQEEDNSKYGKMLEAALAEANVPNPAMTNAPIVSDTPEMNGVPEMDYSAMAPSGEITPPVAPSEGALPPVAPSVEAVSPAEAHEEILPPPPVPPIGDPGAFQIPGGQ